MFFIDWTRKRKKCKQTNTVPCSIGDIGTTVNSSNQLHVWAVYDAHLTFSQVNCYERRVLNVADVKQQALHVVRPDNHCYIEPVKTAAANSNPCILQQPFHTLASITEEWLLFP